MSGNLICFSWNADNIPLCEDYLNNGTTDIIQKREDGSLNHLNV